MTAFIANDASRLEITVVAFERMVCAANSTHASEALLLSV